MGRTSVTAERVRSGQCMTVRVLRAAFALLLALATLGLASAPAEAGLRRDGSSQDLLAAANSARAAAGLAPLQWSPGIASVAQAWSESMAASAPDCTLDYLKHNPGYSSQIPGGWTVAAENVGCAAPASSAVIHDAWMNSAGHRANILDPEFTHMGIGWTVNAAGIAFATQDFAAYPAPEAVAVPVAVVEPVAAAPAPAPAPAPLPKKPAPAAQPKETSGVEPVANPGSAPSASPAPEPTATPSDTPTPSPTPVPRPTKHIDPGLPAEPALAVAASDDDVAPGWVLPTGVATVILTGGAAWLLPTRRRLGRG